MSRSEALVTVGQSRQSEKKKELTQTGIIPRCVTSAYLLLLPFSMIPLMHLALRTTSRDGLCNLQNHMCILRRDRETPTYHSISWPFGDATNAPEN